MVGRDRWARRRKRFAKTIVSNKGNEDNEGLWLREN
jgi:hypothetical protein